MAKDKDQDALPVLSPKEQALAKARRSGRIRGWVEGAGGVVGTLVVLYLWKIFLGVAIAGALGYGGYRYITREKKEPLDPTP